jgi:hypothetical protein
LAIGVRKIIDLLYMIYYLVRVLLTISILKLRLSIKSKWFISTNTRKFGRILKKHGLPDYPIKKLTNEYREELDNLIEIARDFSIKH